MRLSHPPYPPHPLFSPPPPLHACMRLRVHVRTANKTPCNPCPVAVGIIGCLLHTFWGLSGMKLQICHCMHCGPSQASRHLLRGRRACGAGWLPGDAEWAGGVAIQAFRPDEEAAAAAAATAAATAAAEEQAEADYQANYEAALQVLGLWV